MATTSHTRTSIAISANPGDETVQTQQDAEIEPEAARTSPEVRQGSQGLVSGGLEKGALGRRVVLRISQPTQPPQLPQSGRQQLRSARRLRSEASHRKGRLDIMTHHVPAAKVFLVNPGNYLRSTGDLERSTRHRKSKTGSWQVVWYHFWRSSCYGLATIRCAQFFPPNLFDLCRQKRLYITSDAECF